MYRIRAGATFRVVPIAPEELPRLVDALVASYRGDLRGHHINRRFLPSKSEIIEIVNLLLQVVYPGFYGRQDLNDANVAYQTGVLVGAVAEKLHRQVGMCLCYAKSHAGGGGCDETKPDDFGEGARGITTRFLRALPEVRRLLVLDVQAAYDGDPAAMNHDEVILAYPGLLAISVYRIAHELHVLGVPLMPRIMTEWAHGQTGADIHPGATIGPVRAGAGIAARSVG